MTQSRGRLIYFCAAGYVFFFTILPSARTLLAFVACAVAFGIAVHLIRNFDDPRRRHAAFWALATAGAIAWAFDADLTRRFDIFTGLLGMLGWGACALAAASPEVMVGRPRAGVRARRLQGVALLFAGGLALVAHGAAWLTRGSSESLLLSRALATAFALALAVLLAAQTKTRRALATVTVVLSGAGLWATL